MRRLLLAPFLLAFVPMLAAEAVTLPGTAAESIYSRATQTRYRLSICLPADYATSGRSYPIIYALDGLWHFALLAQLENDLVYGRKMPAAIVVTLDYEGGYADTMRLRERDFTPWKFGEGPAAGGGADRYLDFFEHELIPRVEAEYRVDSSDRTLAGHSYGGLFTLYVFACRPALFNRYLAASPSVDRRLVDFIAHRRPSAVPAREIRLDVSCGQDELAADPNDAALLNDLKAAIAANAELNRLRLATRYAVYANQSHGSVRSVSFNYGLTWLFGAQPGSRQTFEFRGTPVPAGEALP